MVHRGPDTPRQLYGGDLRGIAEHLDHLVELGVTVLYLTPFFPAGSNHRYDASSFDRVDPLLGGDEGLDLLLRTAHDRGLRVVGDLTMNHTGDAHEWFVAAVADAAAPEASYYFFERHPDGYACWLGVPRCPSSTSPRPACARGCTTGRRPWSPAGSVPAWTAGGSTSPT